MRKIVVILLFLTAKGGFCQVSETFSGNNFNEFPVWRTSAEHDFIIEQGVLRSNVNTINTNFYISTANALAINCTWEFWVNLKFNTSGANYVDVYLVADKSDLKATLINGYFLRIGGTDDEISLFRRAGTLSSAIKIIDGINGVTNASSTDVRIKVTRNDLGEFKLEWNLAGDGSAFSTGGLVNDLTFSGGGWFGIFVQQSTATFARKHYFDNIKIASITTDSVPPTIVNVNPAEGHLLDVVFSEDIEVAHATDTQNYWLSNGFGIPKSIVFVNSRSVRLFYDRPFYSGNYILKVSSIEDLSGNVLEELESNFRYLAPYTARKGDVVINEIFADPVPTVALPDAEYVELWNTTSEYILLKNWKYGDATSQVLLPADTLEPNTYAILCAKADASKFEGMGKVIALNNWPSLNNDSDFLTLMSGDSVEIDNVGYLSAWHKDVVKMQGGYSLELIDPKSKCLGGQNWGSSKSTEGGTPGRENTIYREGYTAIRPQLHSLMVVDSIRVRVFFSKPVDTATALQPTHYFMDNDIGNPKAVTVITPDYTGYELIFMPIARGVQNVLTINSIADCAGNIIDSGQHSGIVFIPKKLKEGELLLSEVLFNPKQGSVDFVEIYNPGKTEINIRRLQLANVDVQGNPANVRNVANEDILIQPNSWLVITSNSGAVKEAYHTANPENFLETSMPAFAVAKGSVILLSEGRVIDRLDYNAEMHVPLLKDAKGVSLERRTFLQPANASGNFTSASATVGFATPTYQNSVSEDSLIAGEAFSLDTKIFSPDGDGLEDELNVVYRFPSANKMGSVYIYDDRGILKRKLIDNHNLGTTGRVVWDGRDENGLLCKIGIYILKFDVYEVKGKRSSYTKAVVLAGRIQH